MRAEDLSAQALPAQDLLPAADLLPQAVLRAGYLLSEDVQAAQVSQEVLLLPAGSRPLRSGRS